MRQNISSGTKWELDIGYSRLVKVGPTIFVSGTTSIDENGNVVGLGDTYQQTKYIIQKIAKSLERVDTNLSAITRTRIFTTKISEWKEIGRAHSEFFEDIKPATTMVEVKSLIQPELLVEIEADAVILMSDNDKSCI